MAERLQVFISYASEDAALAQAINAELRTAFSPAIIKTTLDSELRLGEEWRTKLEEALRDADVLLTVATGRQRLSHSYTGYEVGYFSASKREKLKMTHFDSDRLIISIGILEKIPETLSDIQNLNLTKTLMPFLVDENILKNKQTLLRSLESNTAKNPLLKLFLQLNDVVQTLHHFDYDYIEDFKKRAKESADRLYLIFFEAFQNRVSYEQIPERKVIVRFTANTPFESHGDLPPDTTLEFIGETFAIFNIRQPPDKEISWANFLKQIPFSDAATAWTDIIKTQIMKVQRGELAENRRLLASSDRKRFFRLFVSSSRVYYSGITEVHMDVVEVVLRDYGDPKTTMLLKALQVGLQYRFLFLEGKSSPFSAEKIEATLSRNLPKAASEVLQELDYVEWLSTDAGLSEPDNVLLLLPKPQKGELERRVEEWETVKSDLKSSALQVLRAANNSDPGNKSLELAKVGLEDSLTRFCSTTAPMNREFLGNVLRLLTPIVTRPDESSTV